MLKRHACNACALVVITTSLFIGGFVHASTHEFYKNKIIRILVGFQEKGAFDIYSRAIARYLTKHIPGNPTVVVENMPGEGSLAAANYAYKLGRPDGFTIVSFHGALILRQLLGRKEVEFDAQKYEWIGVPALQNIVCVFAKGSGITKLEHWQGAGKPARLGGMLPGTSMDDTAKILKEALGLPVELVSGYKQLKDIFSAAERGDLAGSCFEWEVMKLTWRPSLDRGDVTVLLQVTSRAQPDLPNVPLAIDFAKSEEARLMVQTIQNVYATRFLYALPPGTAKERVVTLQKAFLDTMKDHEFLAYAKTLKLDINPLGGEELEKSIAQVFKIEPTQVQKLKGILKYP